MFSRWNTGYFALTRRYLLIVDMNRQPVVKFRIPEIYSDNLTYYQDENIFIIKIVVGYS